LQAIRATHATGGFWRGVERVKGGVVVAILERLGSVIRILGTQT
jgi:hypothetical protein